MSGPPVTVVVITRDRRPELLRTLGFMTALPERPRVIVVDNGSGDGTADAVAEAFPEVRMIRSGENLGAVGRNVAVEQVETPYVAFCDDDTWWEAGALTLAAGLLRTYPKLASVTGHILAGASMVRVRAFREVGGFSPRLWLGGEEELLSLDLVSRGWWLGWAEDVVVHHAASRVRDRRGRRVVGIRNTLWTAWLRRPPGGALRRTAAVLRAVPKDRASAAAVAAAVAGLPWVLRERRVVPMAVEDRLRLLEEPQRTSVARRYVD